MILLIRLISQRLKPEHFSPKIQESKEGNSQYSQEDSIDNSVSVIIANSVYNQEDARRRRPQITVKGKGPYTYQVASEKVIVGLHHANFADQKFFYTEKQEQKLLV